MLESSLPDVPISALEHFSYCPRQCALIHVEQVFDENLFTIRGARVHQRVDELQAADRGSIRVVRAMPLWSDRLGLQGRADLVELRAEGPYPVEYKAGRRVAGHAEVQLCAQALCLEEMLGEPVRRGAVYHHAERRRREVRIDEPLRRHTLETIEGVREILRRQLLPAAVNDGRCPNCSLIDTCLPSVVGERARMRGLQGALFRPISGAFEVEEPAEAVDEVPDDA